MHINRLFAKRLRGDEQTCWMRNSSISLFWRAIWAAKSLLNLVDRLELLFWLIWNCCCSSKDKQRPVETKLEWWVPVAGWGKSGCPEYWDVGTIISSLVLFPKFFLTANKKFKSYNKNHEFLLWGKIRYNQDFLLDTWIRESQIHSLFFVFLMISSEKRKSINRC